MSVGADAGRDVGWTPGIGWVVSVAAAVARRPRLWATALRQLIVLAEPGWWRRKPWLPLPDAGYMHFRMVTAYGTDRSPEPGDVVEYLDWCRRWPAATGP